MYTSLQDQAGSSVRLVRRALPPVALRVLLLVLLVGVAATLGCYNSDTGETNVGGAINFTLPVFPETGGNAVEIFTEMHYQPSYRSQEGPRLLPPAESIPVTGVGLSYTRVEQYADFESLTIPAGVDRSYERAEAQALYDVNCMVCHGSTLRGDQDRDNSPILALGFMNRGPFPSDLTSDLTQGASDGALFAFISGGGRQGLASVSRGNASGSPMPQFGRLLTADERWTLVKFQREAK